VTPSRSVTLTDIMRFSLEKTAHMVVDSIPRWESACRRKRLHVSAILAFRGESYGQISRH
jgi:hypothetical protein